MSRLPYRPIKSGAFTAISSASWIYVSVSIIVSVISYAVSFAGIAFTWMFRLVLSIGNQIQMFRIYATSCFAAVMKQKLRIDLSVEKDVDHSMDIFRSRCFADDSISVFSASTQPNPATGIWLDIDFVVNPFRQISEAHSLT